MKKTFATLLFLVLCGIAYSQEKKLVWIVGKTCENGIEKAKEDFSQKYYFSDSFGLIADTDSAFSEFYKKHLNTKYGIISQNGGCVITEYKKCYSEQMEKLIFEKFGSDIFEKSLKEAKGLYNQKK